MAHVLLELPWGPHNRDTLRVEFLVPPNEDPTAFARQLDERLRRVEYTLSYVTEEIRRYTR